MEFLRHQVRAVMSAVRETNPERMGPGAKSAEDRSTAGARGRDAMNAERRSTTQFVAKLASGAAAMLEIAVQQSTTAGHGRQETQTPARKNLNKDDGCFLGS